jgi:D-alanyl-lipoteichoic acid acyltransferase DltB (MBOAT superfamily)
LTGIGPTFYEYYYQFSHVVAVFLTFLLFPAAAAVWTRSVSPAWRFRGLAVLSMLLYPVLALLGSLDFGDTLDPVFVHRGLLWIGIYYGCVVVAWLLLRRWGQAADSRFWVAFGFPLLLMIPVRFIPAGWRTISPGKTLGIVVIGVSYLAFRLSHLAIEYRNRVVKLPTLSEYLTFALFPPTLSVGPISPYSRFCSGSRDLRPVAPPADCFLRIVLGFTKFAFLSKIAGQFSYGALLLDNNPHNWIDLPVAMAGYYLYLYLSFSGWCDMAIGAAGWMGIPVAENFNHPFTSRNILEYWSRWHMTLTGYLRDVVFTPLSKALVRAGGARQAPHAIAVSLFCVFVAMGIWHSHGGAMANYIVYYLLQALGAVSVHYYTLFLKRKLGRDGYARYMDNTAIRAAAIALTFLYSCSTLLLFANTFQSIAEIWDALP